MGYMSDIERPRVNQRTSITSASSFNIRGDPDSEEESRRSSMHWDFSCILYYPDLAMVSYSRLNGQSESGHRDSGIFSKHGSGPKTLMHSGLNYPAGKSDEIVKS